MYGFARKALFAALLAGVAGPALAADYIEEPIEVVAVGGWYIRGYLGMSNQFFDGLESDLFDIPFAFGWYDEGGFGSAPIVGGGVGYEFNDYLRGDLTVEWRGKSDFYALDWLQLVDGGPITTNEYTAKKSELVFMANGYYDFGDFYGITPYVGAGIGASYNTISHFRDVGQITPCRRLCRRQFRVESRLGAACRPRLPGHRAHDHRLRLQLHLARRCRDWNAPQ